MRQDGFPILAAASSPGGYYLPENQAELDEGKAYFRRLALNNFHTYRSLKVLGNRYLFGQKQGILL
jgi:hypothetical protein